MRSLSLQQFPHKISEARGIIQNYLSTGQAQMVSRQDWQVNRVSPSFVAPEELAELIDKSKSKPPRVVHLGMGDGSANQYYKRHCRRSHRSISFADRIYLDPRDMIRPFIDMKASLDVADEARQAVADILR